MNHAMDLGLLMAWSKCLMPLQMALFDFVFVFILAATAVAACGIGSVTFLGGMTWLK